jgi:nucleoside-diphosphate-sugar epimerase
MKDITDIVVLACTVGTKKYINDPFESYLNSINIINNIIELLDISFKKFKKKYNIIFFSSSDVYIKTNSIDSYITENTPINIITTRNIALYGAVKIIGEILFEKLYA